MKYSIQYFDFRYIVTNKHAYWAYIYFNPENDYFNFFTFSLDNINNLIYEIESVLITGEPKRIPDGEESYYDVTVEEITLVLTLPGYYDKPVSIDTVTFLNVLIEYREWLVLFESCQIPGLIPPSKLDTWSCVPNEYVKPEYWDLLKQQQQKSKE